MDIGCLLYDFCYVSNCIFEGRDGGDFFGGKVGFYVSCIVGPVCFVVICKCCSRFSIRFVFCCVC